VALFQSQPAGLGLFFRPTSLKMIYVQLHQIINALLNKKIAASSGDFER